MNLIMRDKVLFAKYKENNIGEEYEQWLESKLNGSAELIFAMKDHRPALEAIAGLTSDELSPLMRALHEIAHKTLK